MMSVVQSADMYVLVWHGRFTIDSLQKLMDLVGVLDDRGLSPTHFGVPDSRAHQDSDPAPVINAWGRVMQVSSEERRAEEIAASVRGRPVVGGQRH
jgi:hypothetical protein